MKKENDFWTSQFIVEPDTGRSYNNYFYKNRPARRVVIETKKAVVLAGYMLIEKDLRSCIAWLGHIEEELKDELSFTDPKGSVQSPKNERIIIMKGLFVAALTFYGKCFATCEGRKVKLEKSNLENKFHDDHDDALEFRNNYAAHSGAKKLEHAAVVLALDKNKESNPYFSRELYQPDLVSRDDTNRFISLFGHARVFAEGKIETLSDKVYEEDVLPKGEKYWYEKN